MPNVDFVYRQVVEMQVKQAVRPRVYRARERPGGRTVRLTEEIIADFLRNREEKGCTKETLKG